MNELTFPSTKNKILEGPAKDSDFFPQQYTPVDCDFTDELEFLAIKKIPVEITYRTGENKTASVHSKIQDIVTENKEENLKLENGTSIRLDRLVHLRIIG